MNCLVNPVLSFLASALSGALFVFSIQSDQPLWIGLCLCSIGLIPFLWIALHGNLICRIFSFLGFSLPMVLYAGEGMWISSRYFYQISWFPAALMYLFWVWFLGTIHLLIFSLFCKRMIGKNFERLWIVPFFWVALEFLYAQCSIQAKTVLIGIYPPFSPFTIYMARVGGVYAVSFGVVFINMLFLACLMPRKSKIFRGLGWFFSLVFFFLLIVLGLVYPEKKESLKKPFTLALLQPNLQFPFKENSADIQRRTNQLLKMTKEALSKEVDLIVWPASIFSIRDENQIWHFLRTLNMAPTEQTKIMMGLARVVFRADQGFYQNAVYLTDFNGNVKNVYVKQRLTPYTEYIPFGFLDLIGKRKQGSPEYISSKDTDLVLEDQGRGWSTPICLEIFYPELLRRFVREGAEFLIHLSNDDVYGTSSFKEFLLKISAFRALELGIPIFRVAIDGYSAFLDSQGKIVDILPSGKRGILYAKLNQKVTPSLYAKIGDIFGWICVIIVILANIRVFLRRPYSS